MNNLNEMCNLLINNNLINIEFVTWYNKEKVNLKHLLTALVNETENSFPKINHKINNSIINGLILTYTCAIQKEQNNPENLNLLEKAIDKLNQTKSSLNMKFVKASTVLQPNTSQLLEIQIIIAHKKGINWEPNDNIKSMIQEVNGQQSLRLNHLLKSPIKTSEIKELTEIIKSPDVEIIIINWRRLTTKTNLNNQQKQLLKNKLGNNFNQIIIQFQNLNNETTNAIIYTNEDTYNDIKNQKFKINLNPSNTIELNPKPKYKLCNNCKHAYAGYHAKCA